MKKKSRNCEDGTLWWFLWGHKSSWLAISTKVNIFTILSGLCNFMEGHWTLVLIIIIVNIIVIIILRGPFNCMIWTVVIILSQLAGLYFIYVNTTDFINSGFSLSSKIRYILDKKGLQWLKPCNSCFSACKWKYLWIWWICWWQCLHKEGWGQFKEVFYDKQ